MTSTSGQDEERATAVENGRDSFNLLDEPWLPVIDFEGVEREVSLREALLNSHEYRDLSGELPTTRFALLRILLAVSYRVLDQRRTGDPIGYWADLWDAEALPAPLFNEYFDAWHHRFDLRDPEQPFLQSPSLRTEKNEWRPISLIVADVDPDHALFTMSSELEALPLSAAARWLVHAHAYDYSGIKSGVVGDPRVKGGKAYPMGIGGAGWLGGVTVTGKDLRETLLLNFIPNRSSEVPGDVPIWERPVPGPGPRDTEEIGPVGPVSLMTWAQRRIRIRFEEDLAVAALVTNGDELDYTIQSKTELMSGWRFSEPQSAKAKAPRYMARKFDQGRALWRGIATLLPGDGAPVSPAQAKAAKKWNVATVSEPAAVVSWLGRLVWEDVVKKSQVVELSATSMEYGTQNASYAEVVSDRLAFASALVDLTDSTGLRSLAETAVSRAEQAVRVLGRYAADLDRAAGGNGEAASALAESDAFATLDQRFREWVTQLMPDRESPPLLSAWTEQLRDLVRDRANQLTADAPESAWTGRVLNERPVSVATAINYFEGSLYKVLGARSQQDSRASDPSNPQESNQPMLSVKEPQ